MAVNTDGLLIGTAVAGTASSGTFTNVANVQKFGGLDFTAKDCDTTLLTSTEQWEESEPGRKSAGGTSMTLLYEKAATTTVFALFAVKKAFCITLIDGSKWVCDGYINGFGHSTQEGDKVRTECKVKFSGKPVFTPAA